MSIVANLVEQTTTSTGTGNLTLAAVDARQTCASAIGTGSGNTFAYFIMHESADEWERGTGYMLDSTTLVRSTVHESSNANAAVNFSAGTKRVTNAMPADELVSKIRPVANRTALKALNTSVYTTAYLKEDGRAGVFNWKAGDYSSQITADTQEGIFVKADAVASSSGSWVRDSAGLYAAGWFGITPTGTSSANSTAIAAALATLKTLYSSGSLHFGYGTYSFDAPILIDDHPNVTLTGEGINETILDFSATTSTEDGVIFRDQSWFGGLRDLTVQNAARHGIVVEDATGSNPFTMRFINVATVGNGSSGFYSVDGFMMTLQNVRSWNNGADGFTFVGAHTSLHVSVCHALTNTGDGWDLDDLVYSTFTACGADSNGNVSTGLGVGWRLSNMRATTFQNCGAENNYETGFYLETDDGTTSTLDGIIGVRFDGCFGYNNDRGADDTAARASSWQANFMYVDGPVSGDTGSNRIDIDLVRCSDLNTNGARTGTTTYAGPSILTDGYYRIRDDNCVWALAGDGAGYDANQFGSLRTVGTYYANNGAGVLVNSASATNIATIRRSTGRTDEFGGLVVVNVANGRPSELIGKQATYLLLVSEDTATTISAVGDYVGGAADDPAFTFDVVSTKLQMTEANAATNDTFYYSVEALSSDIAVSAP